MYKRGIWELWEVVREGGSDLGSLGREGGDLGSFGKGGDLGKEDEGNWGIGGTVRERKLRIVRE